METVMLSREEGEGKDFLQTFGFGQVDMSLVKQGLTKNFDILVNFMEK